ncbi:hypothetical protein [Natronorubrum sulfidifaciens]|uniref:Uncharacterized protein n=1 Tax=Natronorubrum sulfidifaciens JCM 14089 TaxID=1230460 RepID=L9W6R5_9EURY|nr:hypothetical protein [Natronorubrum sulfidifaciens]ELY45164.1 hypothetical protein C495_09485 [Natronorubrum sulfidifaciens JCM 14089]
MGARIDVVLTLIVLFAASVAVVTVDATLSPLAVGGGALGTLGFELVATRDPAAVRRHWERPAVYVLAVATALIGIAIGAVVAPSSVLSFVLGALVTYLLFVGVVHGYQSITADARRH